MARARGAGRPRIARRSPCNGDGAQRRKVMRRFLARWRFLVGALAFLALVAIAIPAATQQPSSVNPTASSVKEDQLLRELQRVRGRGTIPDVKSYTVEQPAGRNWRHLQEVVLPWVAGIAILGMLVLLAAFYLI